MGISNHDLHNDFPQYSDLIDQLSEHDGHFKKQLKEYSELDKEIQKLEKQNLPVSDENFTQMKASRAHLKDQLYSALKAADEA